MNTVVVDAMGKACPLPVVEAKKALEQMNEPGVLQVRVDNETAVQNLSRLASSKGLKAASQKLGEREFVVRMELAVPLPPAAAGEPEPACLPDRRGGYVVAIGSNAMGSGNDELGEMLMKGFIFALTQLGELPETILFYNGGAKLSVEGSVAVEDLKSLEAQGVEVLTCGTCLNFYGLTEKLAVGGVTNMYAIAEKLAGAARVVRS